VKVREVYVSNWFGRWMRLRGWAGFTLPSPFGATIFYWLLDEFEQPSATTRRHEWVHAKQIERDGWFKFTWRYLWQLARKGYNGVDYEIEAYQRQACAELTAEAQRLGMYDVTPRND
jgi:hypothetical protein